MTKSAIFRLYAAMPPNNDNLARDETTFEQKVMPRMDELKRNDRECTQLERVEYGRATVVW